MINLKVDEAYALDYLSILQLKWDTDRENTSKKESFLGCAQDLTSQLGLKFAEIFSSPEYRDLYIANKITFDAVEKVRTGKEVTAKEVDDANLLRYKAKVALQKKFFGTGLVETKTNFNE